LHTQQQILLLMAQLLLLQQKDKMVDEIERQKQMKLMIMVN
jgi:hypothetical protein